MPSRVSRSRAGARRWDRPASLPPRGCAESEFEAWAHAVTVRTDPFLTWLGIVFALLAAAQLGIRMSAGASHAVNITVWVIWAVFAVDFLLKFWLAPHKRRFLRRHWMTLIGLLLPTLRFVSFLRLLRLGRVLPAARALTTSSRAARAAAPVFRSRVGYLGGLSSIAMLAIAELGYLFDGSQLHTFGAALIWSASAVLGMSPTVTPTTEPGQLVMLLAFAAGVVLISTLAGAVGAFLLHPVVTQSHASPRGGGGGAGRSE